MCFPFAVTVALSTLSPRTFRSKGDLVASLPRVALFLFSTGQNLELVSWDLSTNRLLQSYGCFRSCGVVPGRSWRETRRNACASKLRQVCGSAVGTRGGGTKASLGHWPSPGERSKSASSRKKVHHAAQVRTQADIHTAGRVAMWRTRACARRPFADFETLVLMIFARFSASRRLKYNARHVPALGVLILQNDGVPELTQNNMHRLHVTQIRSRCPTRRTARAQEHICPSHDSNSSDGLASFRMSVNHTEPHVLDTDMGDLGSGGRGALMPRFGSLRIGANCRVPVSSGFRAMSFWCRPCERRAPLTHRVLQLPNCHALSC